MGRSFIGGLLFFEVEVLDQPILRTGRPLTLLQLLQMVSDASGRRQGSSKLSRERVRSMALLINLVIITA
jgi:hypothetical protein